MTKQRIIGVYDTEEEAQKSLETLNSASIPFQRVSMQSPTQHQGNLEFLSVGDVTGSTSLVGAFWGACIGIVLGFLIFAVIEGSATYEERFARMLISLMVGTTLGALAGAVIASLVAITMTRNMNQHLNKRLFVGKYVITMQANHKEVQRARHLVEHTSPL